MKVARDTGYEVTGTFGGEKIEMSIAQSAMAHIMNVLTDLYSNRIYAVIREYCTNAWDAHVEAGVQGPIEVTLPSALAPFLKIKDSGVGLTVEDIHAIYSQYGESTKRGTNEQNGMLGLGCKSALTYTQQFTVTSTKDGTRISVVVGRDEDGSGSMTVVDTVSTPDSNGTEIVVPVERHDTQSFVTEAEAFFRFWPEGTVLVNGKPPKRYEGLRLNDDLYITDYGQSYIVMGNVPYPAPELDHLCHGSVLAFVPIGAVNFPPSREALMDTKATRDTVAGIKATFTKEVNGAIQREVDAAPTPSEAISTIVRWEKKVPGSARSNHTSYTYNGKPLPAPYVQMVQAVGDDGKPAFDSGVPIMRPALIETTRNGGYYSLGQTSSLREVPVTVWPKLVWVTDFNVKHTAQIKRKLVKWLNENGNLDATHIETFVLLRGDAPKSDFIDPNAVVSYETIRKIVLDPKPRASWQGPARIPGSFDVYRFGGADPTGKNTSAEGVPGGDIDQNFPILWVNTNIWGGRYYFNHLQSIVPAGFTLVCLPANRIEKFKRDVPAAQRPSELSDAEFAKWAAALTDDQRLAIHMQDEDVKDCLRKINPQKVDDPALRSAAQTAKIDVSKLMKERGAYATLGSAPMPNVAFKNPLNKYPLFDSRDLARHADHVYLYLNAAYAAI